jgi:hypothetical protein
MLDLSYPDTTGEDHWTHRLRRGDILRLPMTQGQPRPTPHLCPWLFLDYRVCRERECLELAAGFPLAQAAGPDCVTVREHVDVERAGLGAPHRFDLSQRRLLQLSDPIITNRLQPRPPIIGRLSRSKVERMNAIRVRHFAQRDIALSGLGPVLEIDDWLEATSDPN